jgi:hypothetical protein
MLGLSNSGEDDCDDTASVEFPARLQNVAFIYMTVEDLTH